MRAYHCLSTLINYFLIFIFFSALSYMNRLFSEAGVPITPESMKQHKDLVVQFYENRKNWETSNLGKHMFKYFITQPHPVQAINVPERGYFNVLIWRHFYWLKKRHIGGFGQHSEDPLLGCSVTNCKFSEDDDTLLPTADAVLVHLQAGLLPNFTVRRPHQCWIFWSEESPLNKFSLARRDNVPSLHQLANVFNWSMSYRSDSDIPIPYGRTIPLQYPKLNGISDKELKTLVPYWERKRNDVLVAIIMSRCIPFRMQFVMQLQRFMNVDVFGKCAKVKSQKQRCPGHYEKDCPIISEYLFYLVIENSKCRQYISEKVFHHAYAKGAIPIIMGTPLVDCIKLLPPNSFIHIDDYDSIQHLIRHIYSVSGNVTKILSYHVWRNSFKTVEEHGFLGTRALALCRVCEALNYNYRTQKVYKLDDILLYLDPNICCDRYGSSEY